MFPKRLSIPALLADSPVLISVFLSVISILILSILISTQVLKELRPHVILLACILTLLPFSAAYIQNKSVFLKNIIHKVVGNTDSEIDQLFRNYYKLLYESWIAYILPLVIAIVSYKSMTKMTGLPWVGEGVTSAAVAYQTLLILLLIIAAGVGWHFLGFLFILQRLNTLTIKGDPFQSLKKEFTSLNQIALDVVVLGIFIYIIIIIDIWIIPWGGNLLFSNPFGYYWAFPIAFILLGYFVVGQSFTFRLSKHSKQQRLESIDLLINNTFKKCTTDSSENGAKMFGELIKWREIVDHEGEWLIDFQTIVTIISGILIPAIGTLLNIF